MSDHRITERAQKRHRKLIDKVMPFVMAAREEGMLHLIDMADGDTPHRRSDHKVSLDWSERPALRSTGRASAELAYNPDAILSAAAAFLAAITPASSPIANDEAMLALLTLAERVARSTIPVLVEGPTGTGKEVLARYIHSASDRSAGPFIAVNCAAMPETMLEALLFGHKKGAFTGANEAQEGFFRAADGGTLLLDEIGEMPLSLQAKLLRALQEGEVVPLGATQPIKVDVRIVACTNRELPREIAAGRFREDLYYRLNVFPLRIPALRARRSDIAPLAFAMVMRHSGIGGPARWISDKALALLNAHAWPGNVRELENVMRRALLLAGDDRLIDAEHIRFDQSVRPVDESTTEHSPDGDASSLSDIAFHSEAQAILRTLEECNGRRAETARKLGISERTLRYRLADMREAGLKVAGAWR